MKMKRNSIAVGLAVLVAGSAAMAQSGPVRPAYAFPAGERSGGIQMDANGLYATPYASVSLGQDSNLFSSNINKVDSGTEVYVAGVKLDARGANSVLNMDIQAKHGRYNQSSDDNYSDPTFRSTYDVAFDQRNFLRVGFNYLRLHDPRGSTDAPTSGSPDKYYDSVLFGTYAYGAPGAKGRIEVYGGNTVKRYLNNRQYTVNFDRDVSEFGGVFYWRAMPKTSFLVEARLTDLDYKLASSTQSGKETRFYGGVSWEATAATTGTIKIGQLKKEFDSSRPDTSDMGWEGTISWEPRSYSKVDLFSGRTTAESTGFGDYTLSDRSGVNWSHGWNSALSTDAFLNYTKDKFRGGSPDRTDKTATLGLRANYKFRRWLTLGAEYNYTDRNSSLDVNDYDRNVYFLTASMSM